MFKLSILVAALAIAAVAAVGFVGRSDSSAAEPMASPHATHAHAKAAGPGGKAADLRVTLDRLLGEHVSLAVNATRKGYDGNRDFTTAAGALDRNSVELAGAIGSIYGTKARNTFLNGRFMWRDHIRFFVAYTVALKKGDRAGQRKAVANLNGYIGTFSRFLAQATKLPQGALARGITAHVGHLKSQIDAYSRRQYARAYRFERIGYSHMFETGDTLAGAIVKQFPNRFNS